MTVLDGHQYVSELLEGCSALKAASRCVCGLQANPHLRVVLAPLLLPALYCCQRLGAQGDSHSSRSREGLVLLVAHSSCHEAAEMLGQLPSEGLGPCEEDIAHLQCQQACLRPSASVRSYTHAGEGVHEVIPS
jgi:hypothetical protein